MQICLTFWLLLDLQYKIILGYVIYLKGQFTKFQPGIEFDVFIDLQKKHGKDKLISNKNVNKILNSMIDCTFWFKNVWYWSWNEFLCYVKSTFF